MAQDAPEYKTPSKESEAYHEYRKKITRPPYGLGKITALIKQIKFKDDPNGGEGGTKALPAKTYLSLSLQEKFTYNMIHAESYSQNCDAELPVEDEQLKIFGQLPDLFGEYSWDDRQLRFFKTNRDSVMELMKESIGRTNRIGLNFKHVLVEINAKDMIPLLISTYQLEKKDHDILTVLMLLMRDNMYAPFLNSVSYQKLYANKESSYRAYLNFNTANEELIIKRATDFYNELAK